MKPFLFAILFTTLLLASCQSPTPNPYVEQTKAAAYEAIGEMIVEEIRAELPSRRAIPPPPVPTPAKSVAEDPFPPYLGPDFRINARNR